MNGAASPVISVVMANYNCAAYIGAAITSLRRQTFTDWELILVDDASKDESLEAAKNAAQGDPRIRIIEQPANGGAARARNRAIDLARGRWLAVFDSDDLLRPDRLQKMFDHASATGADIVADNLRLMAPEGTTDFIAPARATTLRQVSLPAFIHSNCLYTHLPSLGYLKPMFRREVVGAMRYSETLRNGEDYDFVTRIMARGATLSVMPEALYTYRIHDASVSRTLTEVDLEGLLAANAALAADHAPLDDELAKAIGRRRRTLKALLVFTRMINDLKARRLGPGLLEALVYPPAWLLVSRPVKARLRRVVTALKPRAAPGAAAAQDAVRGS